MDIYFITLGYNPMLLDLFCCSNYSTSRLAPVASRMYPIVLCFEHFRTGTKDTPGSPCMFPALALTISPKIPGYF